MSNNIKSTVDSPLVFRRPDLTLGSLTQSYRDFFDRIPPDEQPHYHIPRPDVTTITSTFDPPLNESEIETLNRWVNYVHDPDSDSTSATIAYHRAISILHVDFNPPKTLSSDQNQKRTLYFIHNNKIDADFTTLSGKGYIDQFNENVDEDPALISFFFLNWDKWSNGTLENTLKLIENSHHLHRITHGYVDIMKDKLHTTADVGVKDSILNLFADLQTYHGFDMSWLTTLSLTPKWINDYAIVIGTRN